MFNCFVVCFNRQAKKNSVWFNSEDFVKYLLNSEDVFTFSPMFHIRGHAYKLYQPRCDKELSST